MQAQSAIQLVEAQAMVTQLREQIVKLEKNHADTDARIAQTDEEGQQFSEYISSDKVESLRQNGTEDQKMLVYHQQELARTQGMLHNQPKPNRHGRQTWQKLMIQQA